MDNTTTVLQLRSAVRDFVDAREWNGFHTPKNLAMSIAIEAAEIMEHFQWCTTEEAQRLVGEPITHAEVADELADVLIYCLSLANCADIDISTAVQKKLTRNESRFPIGQVRGTLGRSEQPSTDQEL